MGWGKMSQADYDLSMGISRRSRRSNERKTRTLLVHRLREGAKAVLRMPLKKSLTSPEYNIYCEPCREWMGLERTGEQFTCPGCERVYILEFAVFAQLPPLD